MATKTEEFWKCPQCGTQVDVAPLGLYAEVTCPECLCKEHVHVQLGNFRLEGVMGIGGMSVVYRALDVTLKRPVALKVLNDTFRDQPERIERFENESAMMARVRHENVTSVYSAGRAYGQFYIAMELVEGKNLETMVSAGHPMQADYALEIVRQVANGLKAASDAGLLHRDMKPGNVLITKESQAKVIDFGLAMDNADGDQEEVIWATPYYVPPETLRREQEDVRTDIYALGMTLRYLLTGVETFESGTDSLTGLLENKRNLPAFHKQRPNIDASLCDLVDHMTAFAANRRPANYDELLEEIEEVQIELERQETWQGGGRTSGWKVMVLIVLVLGCALGLSIPLNIIPRGTTKSEALPVEEIELLPPLLAPLTKGLDLFNKEKYDEATRAFLQAARESQDPCIGATAAYMALILARATVQNDTGIEQQAQALLEQHVASKQAVYPAMEKAWTEFRKHVAWTDPTPSEWYQAQGGWQEETEEAMNREADRLVNEAPTSPQTPVLLQELAERALWTDKPGVIDRCRRKLRELNGQDGTFAVVSQFFNRVFDERLRVRAVAKYVGRRDRIIEELQTRAPTAQDVDALEVIASCDLLPQYFREQVKVQKEAVEIAISMCRLLARKKEVCKPEMSLRHMLWASRYVGEMPVLTCKTRAAGFYTTDAMDGKMETRWCAADTTLGEDLQIRLPHPERLSKVVMHWVDEAELTYTLIARNRGKEVRRLQEVKHTNSTTYNLKGVEVDSMTLSLDKTDWHRSSVREIEIYNAQGRRLFNDLDSSKSIEFKADSVERGHPAEYVMDGNKETRWCAANGGDGHYLEIQLPKPVKVKRLSVDWETDSAQECEVQMFYNGQKVKTIPHRKASEKSDIEASGETITSLRIVVQKAGSSWASIREVRMTDENGREVTPDSFEGEGGSTVPAKVFQDAELVADIIDILDPDALNNNIFLHFDRALQARTKKEDELFRMVAESWKKRLRPGDGAKYLPPEPLGNDREVALNQLIDRCKRCRVVRMNKGYKLRSLNSPALGDGSRNVLDEQTVVFMNRENTLVLEPESETVAMLGIKSERKEDFTMFVGEIQPVPIKTAQLFVEAKAGIIVNSTKDLQPYTGIMKENPTSYLFTRVPRFLFVKK